MSTKPTAAEIAAEIAELKRLRPLVPPTTLFGDSNIDAIDNQIEVLEELMDESDVAQRWLPLGPEDFEDSDDPDGDADMANSDEGRSDDAYSHAMEACNWLEGEDETRPSAGWAELANRK